jgi:hypothetical protein
MFLVEYKSPPDVFTNMVVNRNECMIQHMCDENVTITEWIYPVIWSDDECEEVSITFDETISKLLKYSNFFKVSKKSIDFGKILYNYTPGEILSFETRLPEFSCVLPPTDWGIIDDEINITVTDTFDVTSKDITYRFPISHLVKRFSKKLKIQSKFLKSLKGLTKVYIEENFPICLETLNPRKRVYIAPCFE